MVEKLTGKELVIKVLEDSDEPMSCSEICESKYFKLYARGTDNDQKKAQISSLLSTWSENSNDITKYEKGHNGSNVYTYSLVENENDEEENEENEEMCDNCLELINDCECEKCELCNKLVDSCDCITAVDLDDPISENRGRITILSEPNNTKCYFRDENTNCYVEGYEYNACGSFDIIPGKWDITFYKNKYDECTKEIQVNKSQVRNISIKLEKTNSNKSQSNEKLRIENKKLEEENHIRIEKEILLQERLRNERIEQETREKQKIEELRLEELEQQKERFRQENIKQEKLKIEKKSQNKIHKINTTSDIKGILNINNSDNSEIKICCIVGSNKVSAIVDRFNGSRSVFLRPGLYKIVKNDNYTVNVNIYKSKYMNLSI